LYPSISLFIIYLIVDISLIFGILGQVHFYPTPDSPWGWMESLVQSWQQAGHWLEHLETKWHK